MEIRGPKLLLGEGEEEVRFFNALLGGLRLTGIQVARYDGKGRLRGFLDGLKDWSGFSRVTSIGITRDADDDPDAAFRSIQGALQNAGLPVPTACQAPAAGSITIARKTVNINVRVFLFPDCRSTGMLETLCLNSVANRPTMTCVRKYFACAKKRENRVPRNSWKAKVHAWLASEEEPDKRLGEAAEKGYWPLEHSAFDSLREFLNAL